VRILVVVANYGLKNNQYLEPILAGYRAMTYDVDIVLISDVPKKFSPDIEIIVGMPTKDPHSLPFAHKKIFADRRNQYDLFIFTEDDILITEKNIEAFMWATRVLPKHYLAGFLRYEIYPDGSKNYDGAHHRYHWVPASVMNEGGDVFASFSNTHSACYFLTKDHLAKAIESGGFLVDPPMIKYGLIELNATHPYTQCGFEKVICISRLPDFSVLHLPNTYLGRLGTSESDMALQTEAMAGISSGQLSTEMLCEPEKKEPFIKWSKNYHEHGGEEVLDAIPSNAKKVLNVGGVMGITEAALLSRGMEVASIPIDPVVAQCIQAKGVRITPAHFGKAFEVMASERFDCILMVNIIQHLKEPVEVLSGLRKMLSPDGCIILVAPKINCLKTWAKSIGKRKKWWMPLSFDETRMHMTNNRLLKKWIVTAGLKIEAVIPGSDRKKIIMQLGLP
jgi:2-polyprenyl-3-methyl-5-hydroxy-6-metoxy-1,4-benzoquinol methylase